MRILALGCLPVLACGPSVQQELDAAREQLEACQGHPTDPVPAGADLSAELSKTRQAIDRCQGGTR